MNDDVHRFLDGDLPGHRLQGEERREAAAWERLLEAFRVEDPVGPAPPWLEDRIMDEIHGLPARGRVRRLVEWADVVAENFAPGVMSKWGLEAERLREIKPELIVVSGCLFGQTGPQKSYPGFGGQGAAIAGFNHMTGWPESEALGPYATITDSLAPRYVACALIAALIGCYGFGLMRHVDRQAWRLISQGKRIQHTETLMQHVVQNSFDAVITVSPAGTVETFNRAAEQMTLRTKRRLITVPRGSNVRNADTVSRSTPGRRLHTPLLSCSGSIGTTLSGR